MPSKRSARAFYERNKGYLAGYAIDYRAKIKAEMVEAFGGRCVHCGEADPVVLTLDHVDNDGAEFRRKNSRRAGFKLYAWLRKHGWPKDGLQLLCHNCNYRKEDARRKAVALAKVKPLAATLPYRTSEETKLKLSLALKGKPKPRRVGNAI